ncbi:hypothetical protein FQP90_11990 [Paenarthrobacter nitroguajacolicus]|uniref:Uncharacterized protein n=1 Tax=Paenarthrobacter nitroguajacolicus TaxID=211146 RepID=A0A558GZR4_PAENT|nr:DUF6270 domain-containing protein [Paenarthrobacter nitroguajacolicus]TVU62358.1 hypothetical protein FQP90_11990 [Paenarthrobacter nitroguajacolicus]
MASIYIYGSCVSRDSFDFIDKTEHRLLGYTARQSLISAVSKPYLASADSGSLESQFQLRNLQGDFDGSLLDILSELAPETDYIFWDLTDERLGLIKIDEYTFITKSVELVQSGLLGRIKDYEWIKFGTEEHLELWQEAVRALADFAKSNLPNTKIVLINLPWALLDENGRPLEKTWELLPDEANNLLAKYAAVIRNHLDVYDIEMSWDKATASSNHKWGLAPYHYQDAVYEQVIEQFNQLTLRQAATVSYSLTDLPDPAGHEPWRDAADNLGEFHLALRAASFGIHFEARSSLPAGRNMLVALTLEGADDMSLSDARIMKSGMASIGHFRYLEIESGQRSYFAGFRLPVGVTCSSVKVMGWQIEAGQVEIRNLRLATSRDAI